MNTNNEAIKRIWEKAYSLKDEIERIKAARIQKQQPSMSEYIRKSEVLDMITSLEQTAENIGFGPTFNVSFKVVMSKWKSTNLSKLK